MFFRSRAGFLTLALVPLCAAASGCAIFDQPPTAGIDRRLDCDLRKLGQVLREKLGIER